MLHQSAAADVLKVLTYRELGSLMFNLDLLGYGLMPISTFFIGLTVTGTRRTDRWLRLLLVVHGVFAPMCVALPILDVFAAMPRSIGDATGIAVLLFWCAYFTPVRGLAIGYFAFNRPWVPNNNLGRRRLRMRRLQPVKPGNLPTTALFDLPLPNRGACPTKNPASRRRPGRVGCQPVT